MKDVLGTVAVGIAFIGYVPYLWAIWKGKTRPHAFSWTIWGILTAIAFAAQWVDGAGPGAWVTGVTALTCFIIVIVALFTGRKQTKGHYHKSDVLSFIAALAAIPLWYLTNSPLWSMILVTIIDALGFYTTFRKSYVNPNEELLFAYLMSALKFVVALMALENFTIITALYPFSLVVMNGAFVVMLLWRRKALSTK